ncbi:hypothetical protein [Yinghuangia seranimata]|uniref:hypothetical protein n=1 Tax=Yinghuangia seranimata TaxID=408067 RepID=UPI00248ABA31|nr:hypothetical protein [Yinghuangia seranimata]MDI2127597.1 hypothetical protein [Yinghuangia seranimata]
MTEYLLDAQQIHDVTMERLRATPEARQAEGKPGGGQPGRVHYSLNRAVIVAAVGALEAFNEDLALTAQALDPQAQRGNDWYHIDGKHGMVQTPSPHNLRKMLWTFFRYDPRPAWHWSVTISDSEVTPGGSTWRFPGAHECTGPDAAAFLKAMVKVRHGFAHQDKARKPKAFPGIVTLTPTGRFAIHSHHATNALSVVLQYAVLTVSGLSAHLSLSGQFRWSIAMTDAGWEELLANTPAGSAVSSGWRYAPAL